jgi:peptidoglycan/xylan/chitin deacetylase (PgdA/CDA1 family)
MDKTLIKLYIVVIAAIALAVIAAPPIIGHTAGWAKDTVTHAELLAASADDVAMPASGTGKVVFVMDDGWETQYTKGYEVLKQYGFAACIAVIPAAVGMDGYMDYSELAELYKHGWDMLNHTYNHFSLAELGARDQKEQMVRGREWLKVRGLLRGSDIVVFPGGAFDDLTLHIMSEQGLSAGRSLKCVWVTDERGMMADTRIFNVLTTSSLENIKKEIDKAAANESTVILLFHKIEAVTDETQMQVDKQVLESIAAYIDEQGDKLSVVTLSGLLAAKDL